MMKTAKSLSFETVNYVNALRRNQQSQEVSTAKLKTELANIISESIGATPFKMETVIAKSADNDAISLVHQYCCPKSQDLKLTIYVAVNGQSYLKASTSRTSKLPKAIEEFQKSAAFKRYFLLDTQQGISITAKIPPRQITSRYLSDYLTHMMEHIQPFFKAFNNKNCLTKAA